MPDPTTLSATALARRIRAGKLSSVEATKAYLARIAQRNPDLQALVMVDEKGALARARAADRALTKGEIWGKLHGVPMTIKESLDVAALSTTWGRPELKDNVPAEDSLAVQRELGSRSNGR